MIEDIIHFATRYNIRVLAPFINAKLRIRTSTDTQNYHNQHNYTELVYAALRFNNPYFLNAFHDTDSGLIWRSNPERFFTLYFIYSCQSLYTGLHASPDSVFYALLKKDREHTLSSIRYSMNRFCSTIPNERESTTQFTQLISRLIKQGEIFDEEAASFWLHAAAKSRKKHVFQSMHDSGLRIPESIQLEMKREKAHEFIGFLMEEQLDIPSLIQEYPEYTALIFKCL